MSTSRPGPGGDRKQQLRLALHEVVSAGVSDILLRRLDAVLDGADGEGLQAASVKMARMVALFVGPDEANVLTDRFEKILGRA